MMDRLESMLVLITAVEAGSLSATGRRLGRPLATVSRKVSELESHLRTQLLTRTRQGLTLTDAGRSYVAACKRILEDVGEAERAASGEYSAPRGGLIITAPIVFGRLHVLPIVIEFLKTYPDIDIRMVLADRVTNLLEEQIDVAVRIGELPDSSLVATRVGLIRRVGCGRDCPSVQCAGQSVGSAWISLQPDPHRLASPVTGIDLDSERTIAPTAIRKACSQLSTHLSIDRSGLP